MDYLSLVVSNFQLHLCPQLGRVPPDDEWKLTKRPRSLAFIQPFTPLAAAVTIGASDAKRFWTDLL